MKTGILSKIKNIFLFLSPPPKWKIPVIILLGVIGGLGLNIFHTSNAVSYMSDKPETCVNCHVMAPQYATWKNSSHGRVTVCNDCHVPQDNIFSTYFFKAQDGLRHSYVFTFRLEPQVIRIKEAGKDAVQNNCIRCHSDLIHPVGLRSISGKHISSEGRLCVDCHREVPHGRVNSLSSAPYARVPLPPPVLPKWLDNLISNKKKD